MASSSNSPQQSPLPDRSSHIMQVIEGGYHLMISQVDNLIAGMKLNSPGLLDSDIENDLKDLKQKIFDVQKDEDIQRDGIRAALSARDESIKKEVFDDLAEDIGKEIRIKIKDEVLKEKVNAELKNQLPTHLVEEIKEQGKALLRLQTELHNSQSQWANGLIKSKVQFDEPLHTIVNGEGNPYRLFPKTVNGIYALSADNLKEIAKFYGLDDRLQKVDLINAFLMKCGVGFQCVIPRK